MPETCSFHGTLVWKVSQILRPIAKPDPVLKEKKDLKVAMASHVTN